MNHILCFVGGAVLATAICITAFGSWRQPDKALVLRCRERVERFLELSEGDQKAFLTRVRRNPALHTSWKAVCVINNAFGGHQIALP